MTETTADRARALSEAACYAKEHDMDKPLDDRWQPFLETCITRAIQAGENPIRRDYALKERFTHPIKGEPNKITSGEALKLFGLIENEHIGNIWQ